jgi:hypothetical protein
MICVNEGMIRGAYHLSKIMIFIHYEEIMSYKYYEENGYSLKLDLLRILVSF